MPGCHPRERLVGGRTAVQRPHATRTGGDNVGPTSTAWASSSTTAAEASSAVSAAATRSSTRPVSTAVTSARGLTRLASAATLPPPSANAAAGSRSTWIPHAGPSVVVRAGRSNMPTTKLLARTTTPSASIRNGAPSLMTTETRPDGGSCRTVGRSLHHGVTTPIAGTAQVLRPAHRHAGLSGRAWTRAGTRCGGRPGDGSRPVPTGRRPRCRRRAG